MVVKEKRGRRRYIVFRVAGRMTDQELLAALNAILDSRGIKSPKVVQFDGVKGIFRCSPADKDRIVKAFSDASEGSQRIETLSASGTLLTLREKYFPKVDRRE